MVNIYDRIVKEIIEEALYPLAEIVLKIPIEKTQEIKDKIQTTLEREGDHLKIMLFKDKNLKEILHLEFHVNDENIGKLVLLKKAMLSVNLNLPVRQFVIFMGNRKKPKYIKPFFRDKFTNHRFAVISLKSINWRQFLKYDIPEIITFAILADYGNELPEDVFREILTKMDRLSGGKSGASKHVRRLAIFSNLRKLQPKFIEISNQMAFTYDIENDFLYKQGIETATEKDNKRFATNLLLDGEYPDKKIASLVGVSFHYVQNLRKELEKKGMLSAKSAPSN